MKPSLWLVVPVLFGGLAFADTKEEPPKLSKEEQKVLELTNKAREKGELPPLKVNPVLTKVARAHSANMAKQKKMEHKLDGKDPADRVEEAGYDYRSFGENIAAGLNVPVEAIFKSWMESEGHRKNILSGNYEEIGIGVAADDTGELYYTQVFGTAKKKR
jgi:uncharacterized protein YkwD